MRSSPCGGSGRRGKDVTPEGLAKATAEEEEEEISDEEEIARREAEKASPIAHMEPRSHVERALQSTRAHCHHLAELSPRRAPGLTGV